MGWWDQGRSNVRPRMEGVMQAVRLQYLMQQIGEFYDVLCVAGGKSIV